MPQQGAEQHCLTQAEHSFERTRTPHHPAEITMFTTSPGTALRARARAAAPACSIRPGLPRGTSGAAVCRAARGSRASRSHAVGALSSGGQTPHGLARTPRGLSEKPVLSKHFKSVRSGGRLLISHLMEASGGVSRVAQASQRTRPADGRSSSCAQLTRLVHSPALLLENAADHHVRFDVMHARRTLLQSMHA